VAAIVLPTPDADLASTLEAIEAQVYGVDQIVVVGARPYGVSSATLSDVAHADDVAQALDGFARSRSHVWFVRAGALPETEALGSLISESNRVGAGIAGSKIVADDGSPRLLEVGMATDVFGIPYNGLEVDEIDAGQYDVVRDVAWVSSTSMLVRRDLLVGLGGLATDVGPGAAGLELCHRAHLRGARVVVVPSAVVAAPPEMLEWRGWRERAGQIRAVATSYSALTLSWVLPLRLLIGLLEAIVAPFVGRWTLFSWGRAWGWFVVTLPVTFARRRATRLGAPQPDEELFRYQVRGSARLRTLGSVVVQRIRDQLPQDDRFTLTGLGRDLRQPSFVAGALTVVFALLATRSMWDGLPTAGHLAPLGDEAGEAISTYAGGWNPAGLGSAEPVDPLVGTLGIAQRVAFGDPGLAIGVVALGAVVAAVWGMVRLLRNWGIDTAPAIAAGVVLVGGPATRAIASETAFGVLVATALLPWAVRAMTAPWPEGWVPRIGRVATIGVASALVAGFAPLVLLVAVAAVFVWMIFGTARGRWLGLGSAVFGVVVAFSVLRPWSDRVDVEWLLEAGTAYWRPGPILLAFVGLVAVGTVVFAPGQVARAAAWGSFIGVAGATVARLDELGVGRQPELAGLAAVAFGSAVVVAAALEGVTRSGFEVRSVGRVGIGVAAAAALVVVVAAAPVMIGGRLGLPGGTFPDMVEFVAAADDGGEARVLLLGDAPELPGTARDLEGASYRVVDAPDPHLAAVRPAPPSAGDAALDEALRSIAAGETQRAGATLAPFGIRWVILAGETPFAPLLTRQLDLRPLNGLSLVTYVSDVESGRAVTTGGDVWRWTGTAYEGTPLPGGTVTVAETADSRWGPPPWEQAGWANSVDASAGAAAFDRDTGRTGAAGLGFGLFATLAVVAIVARRWR
jgi:hypothetical protein